MKTLAMFLLLPAALIFCSFTLSNGDDGNELPPVEDHCCLPPQLQIPQNPCPGDCVLSVVCPAGEHFAAYNKNAECDPRPDYVCERELLLNILTTKAKCVSVGCPIVMPDGTVLFGVKCAQVPTGSGKTSAIICKWKGSKKATFCPGSYEE